ncbi:MAG: PfkB family carbohydrate kinase, partial [Pirellulaceae bacterium]
DDGIQAAVKTMCNRYGDAICFVTAGARGAYVVDGDEVLFRPAPTPDTFRDSVGAGDAFAAMTIEGLMRDRESGETLSRATTFAAKICGVAGATSQDASLYRP